MQPTYLPWLGYLGMVASCDSFVFLDSVQFSKRSWQQRNRVLVNGEEQFLTIPVLSKGRQNQLIYETQIDSESGFEAKHLRTLAGAYGKLPYFKSGMEILEPRFNRSDGNLANFTIGLTETVLDSLGVSTERFRSRDIEGSGQRAEYLASIVEKLGGTVYLAAPGSKPYIDESDSFSSRGIKVEYFDFSHPVYDQGRSVFISHLAFVDALFRLGATELRRLISEGRVNFSEP